MREDWTDRFLAKITEADNGCWEWQAARLPTGYGRFYLNGKHRYAHRVAYEAVKGPIPDGLVIDHLCRNTSCANPDHLEAVTNRVNVLRGVGFFADRARQTRCIRGHRFDAANTYRARNGTRKCRTCRRAAACEYRRRRRGVRCAAA
ncbi:HNH endonuclease signature motif containing protein [Streptomyces sp. Da 82-17]|uniref:HNH endonuclease signature motif containing protein n=1 Tax=Streptomyces sp. Da 82-17 TaxID=3377116 RepID=UPI0038D4F6AE